MNRVFKTSIWHRYGSGLVVIICCINIYSFEPTLSKIGWTINAIFWAWMLFRSVGKKIYIRIKDDNITINEGRKSYTFPITEIEFIKMNYHPFGNSYFQLNDGRKISFLPRTLSDKEADSLREICADIRG